MPINVFKQSLNTEAMFTGYQLLIPYTKVIIYNNTANILKIASHVLTITISNSYNLLVCTYL